LIPPRSSIEPISSNVPTILPPISSNKPPPIKLREFVVASKATSVFVPWNFGTSKSSLLV